MSESGRITLPIGGDVSALERARLLAQAQWERFARWQTPFSIVSALIPLLLALVFLSDLLFPHPRIDASAVTLWLLVYLVAGVIPLVFGHRYPRWAGILMVALIEVWSSFFLVFVQHPHAEINALLELPVIALYVGWFYSGVVARMFMGLSILRVGLSLIWNPDLGHGLGSPTIMIAYSVFIALFCFEGARAVRRQGQVQARTDSLTGALNRRGLLMAADEFRQRARQAGEPVAVALIDFDDFRLLNEEGGHVAGDEALRENAEHWMRAVGMRGITGRSGGLVARLGGDEFVVVLRASRTDAATQLCEMRKRAGHAWSFGLVAVGAAEDLDAAIQRADAELYRAKGGR
ncbi:diguanylate cyclase [Leucobacter chromiireducens]|uniref:GGDEF domain-containing protein n=1 Tax=Leucobacter chromiireducens TaxID=283877 RepID=UPI003F80BE8D